MPVPLDPSIVSSSSSSYLIVLPSSSSSFFTILGVDKKLGDGSVFLAGLDDVVPADLAFLVGVDESSVALVRFLLLGVVVGVVAGVLVPPSAFSAAIVVLAIALILPIRWMIAFAVHPIWSEEVNIQSL